MARSKLDGTRTPLAPNIDQAVPAWIVLMKKAAMEALHEEDIKEIVVNQVQRAKDGDKSAIKFIFDQVLGGAALKGATFVQNVYEGGDDEGGESAGSRVRPDKPCKDRPGSIAKIKRMQTRVKAGLSPFNDADFDGDDPHERPEAVG